MFGIDLSHNNGTIDWNLVLTNNPPVDFCYMKATQGVGYTDPMVKVNSNAAKTAGIKIGYYHFASVNKIDSITDAASEADYFSSVLKTLPASDLPLVLDIETNEANLDKNRIVNYITSFFSQMNKSGNSNLALYSYAPFLNTNLPPNHTLGFIKLWLAQYNNHPSPNIPNGWKSVWLWQYTDKGIVSGIHGNVDLNKALDLIV
jgi:lysozyme